MLKKIEKSMTFVFPGKLLAIGKGYFDLLKFNPMKPENSRIMHTESSGESRIFDENQL